MSVLVGSRWNAGALEYFDSQTGKGIVVFDPETLSLVIPSGATLDVSAGTIKLPDGTVVGKPPGITPAILADGAVTFAKTTMFVSNEQTGTGEPQQIAHGLGSIPAAVLIVPTDTSPDAVSGYTATEGEHDNTNVAVTVSNGKKFKVWAMA